MSLRGAAYALGLLATVSFLFPYGSVVAEPTPGLACQLAAAGAPTLRMVPEPEATNDYISFSEAQECLDAVAAAAPDFIEVKSMGKSAGWDGPTGHETFDVLLVEVTNERSATPFDAKIKHVFQLSIHGNEKGGREGGLRVIEDLARCLDTPGAITAEYPELCAYLDHMVAIFTFPNPDGWTHEELTYVSNVGLGGFVRENGNGMDLNRQWPTKGWSDDSRQILSQPEVVASAMVLPEYTNIATATDIHGMLTPTDADPAGELSEFPNDRDYAPGGSLLEGLLDAGQSDPLKMLKTTRLAELLKERVNSDPMLAEWNQAPATGVWGGQVMEWGTSWDTIGYVDSGFTGDFFFQEHGLNATAMDFEMAYNHIVCDNHYLACGMEMNRLHTRLVRQTVAVFMASETAEVAVSLETSGTRTAFLNNPRVVSSLNPDGSSDELTGWALENTFDDAFDFQHVPYTTDPNEYFEDLSSFLRDGEKPGVLESIDPSDFTAEGLSLFDNIIIAGSAYDTVANDPASIAALAAWVRAGGNLVLTDAALSFLEGAGLVAAGSVQLTTGYAGFTDFEDRNHPLAAGLRGLARQTYEVVPLGYQPGQAPILTIDRAELGKLDASVVGSVSGGGGGGGLPGLPGEVPALEAGAPNFGEIPLGSGTIRFLGALLPDPTEEFYHPYGLDSYATTYTGNQLLRNMLGWQEVYAEPPRILENLGQSQPIPEPSSDLQEADEGENNTPGPGAFAFVVALVAAGVLLRIRRQ